MKKIECVIFDMDGTLFDTSEGIFDSYAHVAKTFKKTVPELKDMYGLIGGPLKMNLKSTFGLNDDESENAVDTYRRHYSSVGIKKSKMYPNVKSTIQALYNDKVVLGVATLKRQDFAGQFIEKGGLMDFFKSVKGMDAEDRLSKEILIKNCMAECHARSETTLVVGDSTSDLNGAQYNDAHFLAVTWGFGFDAEFCIANNIPYVSRFEDIIAYISETLMNS